MTNHKALAMPVPTETDVDNAVNDGLGERVMEAIRFPTGNHHYVYDIVTSSGKRCVARLTLPAERRHFEGAHYWAERLLPLGVPLPEMIAFSLAEPFPYMLMERLPGTDLGKAYNHLSGSDKKILAAHMAAMQEKLHALPLGKGFGYAFNYHDPFPHASWNDVVQASLDRSRQRIVQGKIFDPAVVSQVAREAESLQAYFALIPSRPFLHDTTTKNVIVDQGRLTGIVDVDSLCFGDRLLTPALTHMALLASGQPTDYVEYWLDCLALDHNQRRAFTFYTAQCCVDFMGEVGQVFNGNTVNSDKAYCRHLLALLEKLLSSE